MNAGSSFLEFVQDQLGDLAGVTTRAMFGGFGLYLGGAFFGIVYDDRLYLKTDDDTRGWYEARGMTSFQPNEKQALKNYLEVPPDTIEDGEELRARAVEAAGR